MDDPSLDERLHVEALRALGRVDAVSFGWTRVWSAVRRAAEGHRTVRVLDLACGGGDVLRRVGRRARAVGVEVVLHGCDRSPVALEFARSAARGDPRYDFYTLDVVGDALPTGYDVVCSSLFLHHLEEGSAVRFLRSAWATAGRALVVQDLRRTRLGALFAWVGLHAMTRSPVALEDGMTSVRGAFTIEEAHGLVAEAGVAGATIRTVWPQRFVIEAWR